MLSKIYNLLNYCYEDSMLYQFASLEFQLFLLSTKSLIPYEDRIGCMFDANRYKKELEVFAYYKNGKNENIDFYIKSKRASLNEDELLEYKLLPIIIANTNWNTLEDEVMKLTLMYTYNKHSIIDSIILSSVIFNYMNLDNLNIDILKNTSKERLIQFSLKEFLEKYNIQIDKKLIIEYEQERINIISGENILERLSKLKSAEHIYNNRKGMKKVYKENELILKNFTSYIFKLRKGIINPEKLIINYNNMRDLKELLKNNEFNHPFLGKCKIIKRNDKEIILRNKLGLLKVNI